MIPRGTLGRYRYDTLARADVVGEVLIREETTEFDRHVVSDNTLAAELSAVGLERHPAGPGDIQAWRRLHAT